MTVSLASTLRKRNKKTGEKMRKIKENVNPSRNNDETQKSALHSKSLVYSFNAVQCIVRGRTSNNNNKKQPLMQLNEMWL